MIDESAVTISEIDGISVVSFTSEIISGGTGVDLIAAKLRRFIADNNPDGLVVDFTGVKFFSSLMLGLLVDVWRRLKDYGGVLVISGIDPTLTRVFKITNLDKVFTFAPDTGSAIATVKSRGSSGG